MIRLPTHRNILIVLSLSLAVSPTRILAQPQGSIEIATQLRNDADRSRKDKYKFHFKPVKTFAVKIVVDENARALGALTRHSLEDFAKLRYRDTFPELPPLGLTMELDPNDYARQCGVILISVSTIGHNHLVAYHVNLQVHTIETLNKSQQELYQNTTHGCGPASEIKELTQIAISDLLEKFAGIFFKSRE